MPAARRPPSARDERWSAAAGYLVVVFGLAGAAFERGAPPAGAPAEQLVAFVAEYRRELVSQSLLFVLGAGAYLWFFGALRSALHRAEGRSGTLAHVAFGAGLTSVALQILLQVFQVALATATRGEVEPSVAGAFGDVAWALSVAAYVPLSVMYAAVAFAALHHAAFPRWIGWLSSGAAAAHLVMAGGLVVESGPLLPGGVLTYLLYTLSLVWLLTVTTRLVMTGEVASEPN